MALEADEGCSAEPAHCQANCSTVPAQSSVLVIFAGLWDSWLPKGLNTGSNGKVSGCLRTPCVVPNFGSRPIDGVGFAFHSGCFLQTGSQFWLEALTAIQAHIPVHTAALCLLECKILCCWNGSR